jgi:hypothetical protein
MTVDLKSTPLEPLALQARVVQFNGATIGFSGGLPRFSIFRWQTPRLSKRGWTTDSKTALKLRELRKLADETKNHDLERDLYVEERNAERGILLAQYWREGWKGRLGPRMRGHCLWIAVMGVYWALADYGRSFVRPLIALVLSVLLFHWAYGLALVAPSDPTRLADFRNGLWAFSISPSRPPARRNFTTCREERGDANGNHVFGVCDGVGGGRRLGATGQSDRALPLRHSVPARLYRLSGLYHAEWVGPEPPQRGGRPGPRLDGLGSHLGAGLQPGRRFFAQRHDGPVRQRNDMATRPGRGVRAAPGPSLGPGFPRFRSRVLLRLGLPPT